VKKVVETRVHRCGLDRHVNVMHSPLSKRGEYQFDPNMLRADLGSDKADWIVIDGPSGPEDGRGSTLPSLAPFCRPGTRWFLDDAYRDKELSVLNKWTTLNGIMVDGIHPIGKGLDLRPPQTKNFSATTT
jgi:hypothetical protein